MAGTGEAADSPERPLRRQPASRGGASLERGSAGAAPTTLATAPRRPPRVLARLRAVLRRTTARTASVKHLSRVPSGTATQSGITGLAYASRMPRQAAPHPNGRRDERTPGGRAVPEKTSVALSTEASVCHCAQAAAVKSLRTRFVRDRQPASPPARWPAGPQGLRVGCSEWTAVEPAKVSGSARTKSAEAGFLEIQRATGPSTHRPASRLATWHFPRRRSTLRTMSPSLDGSSSAPAAIRRLGSADGPMARTGRDPRNMFHVEHCSTT